MTALVTALGEGFIILNKSSRRKSGISYTINDLAAYTGLSRSTVSRVINQSEQVSIDARKKVLDAIEELGYVPNLIARGLRTEPNIIGVVMQDILNPYYIEALYEIEKLCKAGGYALLNMNSDSDPEMEYSNIYQLLSMKVQGIILIANMLDETNRMVALAMKSTQIVTMEGKIKGVDSVTSDPFGSIEEMVEVLVKLGHRKIGLVHHDMRSMPIIEREGAFLSALSERGITVEAKHLFYGNDYTLLLDQAVEKNDLPTAIFTLNDKTAFNLYRWCRSRDIKVPEQLSIIGFDDVKTYEMMMPTLSTVHQPIGKLAEIATKTLIERIECKGDNAVAEKPKEVRVGTKFLLKESIGKPRAF